MAGELPPIAMLPSWMAHDPRMTYRRFKVCSGLTARRNQKTKLCIPSLNTLHQDTCLYPQDVHEELKSLKADGWISWKKRFNEHGGAISNSYTLHFMADVDKALEGSRGKPDGGSQEKPNAPSQEKPDGPTREKTTSNNEGKSEASTKENTDSISPGGSPLEIKKEVEGNDRPKPKQRRTLLREEWKPTEKQRLFCKAQGYDPDEVTEDFLDFYWNNSVPMADWDGAWVNFVSGRKEYLEKARRNRQLIARNRRAS